MFLLSLSGLAEETFLALKKIVARLEREVQTETDCARLAQLAQLTR